MYRIYHTEGVVLGSFVSGEGSKILSILSKDIGLVRARAQSVREERSKLRYSLGNFTLSQIDLVRGKSGWRVISATAQENLASFSNDKRAHALGAIKRISCLLEKLLPDEEKNEELFSDVVLALRALKSDAVSNESMQDFEVLLLMKILSRLGYWGEGAGFKSFLEPFEIDNPNTLASFMPVRSTAIRLINESLKETQL